MIPARSIIFVHLQILLFIFDPRTAASSFSRRKNYSDAPVVAAAAAVADEGEKRFANAFPISCKKSRVAQRRLNSNSLSWSELTLREGGR